MKWPLHPQDASGTIFQEQRRGTVVVKSGPLISFKARLLEMMRIHPVACGMEQRFHHAESIGHRARNPRILSADKGIGD
jgi:hypothetical protein